VEALRVGRRSQHAGLRAAGDRRRARDVQGARVLGVPEAQLVASLRDAAPEFERAFHNPDHLESLWVPTNAAIGREVLMRLMPKSIEIVGVTAQPHHGRRLPPPGRRFLDARRCGTRASSCRKRQRYIERHQLGEAQMRALDAKAEEWANELEQASQAVKDPELREAVLLLSFNFHHDRGLSDRAVGVSRHQGRLWVPGLLEPSVGLAEVAQRIRNGVPSPPTLRGVEQSRDPQPPLGAEILRRRDRKARDRDES